MAEEIDTRVSLGLHPSGVTAIEGYNEETAPLVADVVNAFSDATLTIGKVYDASEASARNPAWTEENRILIVGTEAAQQEARLLRKMDSATTNLEKVIAGTESELSKPLRERAGLGNLNPEVRAHAKGLKREERGKLINDAFDNNDLDTLQAILGAQPFLSGLSAPEHDYYLRRFHERQNPKLVARLGVMRGALDKLNRDATLVMVEMAKAVGAPSHKVSQINAANERALTALRIDAA